MNANSKTGRAVSGQVAGMAILLAMVQGAFGADRTWTNTVGGSWGTALLSDARITHDWNNFYLNGPITAAGAVSLGAGTGGNGVISNGASRMIALVKNGTGTLTLSATNAYTGAAAGLASAANPLPFEYTEGQTAPRREVRDPCVIREGDTYYLTFTMWPFSNREEKRIGQPNQGGSPGVALYASKDLKTWAFSNWLVKSSELPEDCPYKNRFWAPEIHAINGKFYLIFTADNWIKKAYNPAGSWGSAGYSFIGVADRVTGPYAHVTYVPGGTCDMTLFGDRDGQVYAVKPKGDVYLQKIDLSGLPQGKVAWAGKEERVVTSSNADIGLATSPAYLEGPWLERIGNAYYLFYAEIYKDAAYPDLLGYRTSVAVAASMGGPWRKDPRGQVFFGGHLAVFDGPDGRKWFSYRWEKDNRARGRLCADPVDVGHDGRVQARETLDGNGAFSN